MEELLIKAIPPNACTSILLEGVIVIPSSLSSLFIKLDTQSGSNTLLPAKHSNSQSLNAPIAASFKTSFLVSVSLLLQ